MLPQISLTFSGYEMDVKRVAVVGSWRVQTRYNRFSTDSSDGTLKGSSGDRMLSGKRTWEDGFFCIVGTPGSEVLDIDCQIIEIPGDTFKITRGRVGSESVLLQLN